MAGYPVVKTVKTREHLNVLYKTVVKGTTTRIRTEGKLGG